jgi:hypothetical protein
MYTPSTRFFKLSRSVWVWSDGHTRHAIAAVHDIEVPGLVDPLSIMDDVKQRTHGTEWNQIAICTIHKSLHFPLVSCHGATDGRKGPDENHSRNHECHRKFGV